MLGMLKRLVAYSILRLVFAIKSLFTTRKELAVTLLLVLTVSAALYMRQDSKNQQLLDQAITGDAETITQVVEDGAWIRTQDEFGRSALHIAARYSNVETVRALLEMGAPVNALDFRGRTPLHMTRFDGGGNTEIVRLLLEHGADPTIKDYKDRTPLDILEHQNRYNKPAEDLLKAALRKRQQQNPPSPKPEPSFLPKTDKAATVEE